MNTSLTILMDKNIKNKAQIKAKEDGLSLKAVIVMSLKAYSDGKLNFGAVESSPEVERVDFNSKELDEKAKELGVLLKKLEMSGKLNKSIEEQLNDL